MMPPGSTPPPAPVPAPPPSRSLARAEQVARAVLYEGYILYPYRPSSVKNRQRWSFGGVYPQAYSAAQGGTDAWTMHTECLIADGAGARIDVRVRFLQIQDRIVAALDPPLADLPPADRPAGRAVPRLQVGDEVFQSWQE
ncbi:MAG TPA: hypothetical protein VKY74_02510, partial [Chloroflexia bacterium]|nr:hypothetical protein [Chloroflexia bacterium]